jgi:DNA-directed RNA polymerase sigma subunit (sigma70/sigma32)
MALRRRPNRTNGSTPVGAAAKTLASPGEGALSEIGSARGLSEREHPVLRGHFGLDAHTQSLREIAGRLGVSAERVRQFENRALGKLRAAATGESNPD